MALTDIALTEINALTNKRILPVAYDTIFRASPVLTRIQSRNQERYPGGTLVQTPLIVGRLKGGKIGRGGAFDTTYVTTDAAMTNTLKVYWVGITLYGYDSIANSGPEAVLNQSASKFNNAGLTMAELLATDMWANSSVLDPLGLTGMVQWYDDGNTHAAVGGITRSNILANGTVGGLNAYTATLTSFTQPQLNIAYGAAWTGADYVDLIATTQNGWNLLWNSLQPTRQHMDESSDLGKIGFMSVRFNQAEVVVDNYMPTGSNGLMVGMCTKYIEWHVSVNPRFNYGFTGYKEQVNSNDFAGQFQVACELVVNNPRSGFKLVSAQF